jgi:hypothetical protein
MYYAPYYTFGGKNPSQGYANAQVATTLWTETNRNDLDALIRGNFTNYSPPWIGLITESTAIVNQTNRYKYKISKVLLTATPDDFTANTITDPDKTDYKIVNSVFTTTVTAYNLYEFKHTSSGNTGDGTPLADIPAGFAVVPVVGVVTVHQIIDSTGSIIYVFERNNGIGGACA